MPQERTILVTGSNGQLGSELKALSASFPDFKFAFFSRAELPIHNAEAVAKCFAEVQPSFVVNCAAYTAVDKAETEREQAMAINATAVGYLARESGRAGARFIHISTDYVFDGSSEAPLKEDAAVAPVNFYGETKLCGEQEAFSANAESVVIRTSWVYSSYGNNFVKTMLRLMPGRESINVVADQFGSPTYAADLAQAILQIIESGNWQPGIYHYSNDGVISWAQFAAEIGRLSNNACRVNFITTEQYPTPAKRPRYSVMDKAKITTTYGLSLQPWAESLHLCLEKIAASAVLSSTEKQA